MSYQVALSIFLLFFCSSSPINADVNLTVNGLDVTIENEYAQLDFSNLSRLNSLRVNGTSLAVLTKNTFYLDWSSGGQGTFQPSSLHIVEQTSSRVHFYWLQENKTTNSFDIELHYIMESGLKGIYSYAKYTNNNNTTLSIGETRVVYRLLSSILTQGTNQVRFGTVPTSVELNDCKSVQDSTWLYPNGTYYSKYDFAAYIRQIGFHGVYGNGYGFFVVSPSKEYHGGGPLKQDLTVHQECLVANYFVSGHFGYPSLQAAPGWTHIYGPFLLYFPMGDDGEILEAVTSQVEIEKEKWPYTFVDDDEYPLDRGSVSGYVTGQTNASVVLWDSVDEEFDRQQLGYLYNTETDSTGYFSINNVRPGYYKITAYPTAGLGSDSMANSTVTVKTGGTEHVNLTLSEPDNIMWAIGEANRLSNEFKYSDQPRNYKWEWKTPTSLNFTIGESDPANDWYYAQSLPARWNIHYQDTQDGSSRTLRIGLAAASQKTHFLIYVNGDIVGQSYYDSDSSIYRSAMNSGWYHSKVIALSSSKILNGTNIITLVNKRGQIMYDVISLQKN